MHLLLLWGLNFRFVNHLRGYLSLLGLRGWLRLLFSLLFHYWSLEFLFLESWSILLRLVNLWSLLLDWLMLLWLINLLWLSCFLDLLLTMNVLVFVQKMHLPLVDVILILVLVSEWCATWKRLLLEFLGCLVVLFDESCELS